MFLSEFDKGSQISDLGTKKMLNKARAKFPLAGSDLEALARYIKDQEESDIESLQHRQDIDDHLFNKIEQTEHELEQKIRQVQADIAQIAARKGATEGLDSSVKAVKERMCAKHVSPSGAETTMCPDDDDYEINYGKKSGIADFRKKQSVRDDDFDQGVEEGTDIVPAANPKDTVSIDIPLLIRLLEYAREDAKTDIDLHDVAERLITMSAGGKTLSMNDYDTIIPGSSN